MSNNVKEENKPEKIIDSEEGNNEEAQGIDQDLEKPEDIVLNFEKIINELKEEMESIRKEKLMAIAESQNANKRADKRIADASKYANTSICKSLLAVADNLQRAVTSISDEVVDNNVIKKLIKGVEMTSKELLSVLESQGVSKIDSLHKKFDPNIHQAMQKVKNDKYESGTIIEVFQDGYMIADRLLRPAMVVVSE